MFEKVNPMHPDKIADRIAGALVDYAYKIEDNPKIAVEVLIGHGNCHIIAETSVTIPLEFVEYTVARIAKQDDIKVDYREVAQDAHLAANQNGKLRCGDNGIFSGVESNEQEAKLSEIVHKLYKLYPTDGKYIIRKGQEGDELIVCQSCTDAKFVDQVRALLEPGDQIFAINPLGEWTGGVNVDSGATNRKLGSDMGRAVTGGGLHGKDLSKADVSLNIYAHIKALNEGWPVEISCAIGDEMVDGMEYGDIVEIARDYIKQRGGFEKFAEWGLI